MVSGLTLLKAGLPDYDVTATTGAYMVQELAVIKACTTLRHSLHHWHPTSKKVFRLAQDLDADTAENLDEDTATLRVFYKQSGAPRKVTRGRAVSLPRALKDRHRREHITSRPGEEMGAISSFCPVGESAHIWRWINAALIVGNSSKEQR